MATNALRDDLFALIQAFASPRQGAGDNVALTSQKEVEKQQAPQPPPWPQPPQTPPISTPQSPAAKQRAPLTPMPEGALPPAPPPPPPGPMVGMPAEGELPPAPAPFGGVRMPGQGELPPAPLPFAGVRMPGQGELPPAPAPFAGVRLPGDGGDLPPAPSPPGSGPLVGMPAEGDLPPAPALPFTVPEPVATRKVTPPSGPQSPRGRTVIPELPSKPTPNEPPLSTLPERPISTSPALTGPTGFAGGPRAGAGAATDTMPPASDGGAGNIMDLVKQQRADALAQAAANRRAGGLQQLVSGGQLLASALTRSPSMRSVLAGAAGQNAQAAGSIGAGGGGGDGKGAGIPSLAEMISLQKLGTEAAESQAFKRRLPGLARQLGVSIERLEAMAPKDVSELTAALSKPDLQVREMDDGRFQIFSKNNPEQTLRVVGQTDAYKVEDQTIQRTEEQRKAAAFPTEQQQREATLAKTGQEVTKGQRELDLDALAGNRYADLSKSLGIPQSELEVMGPAEVRRKLDEKYKRKDFEPTADMKEFELENEQRRKLQDPNLPEFRTIGDWQDYKNRLVEKQKRIEAGLPVAAKDRSEITGAAASSNAAIRESYAARSTELNLLRSGSLVEGTAWSEGMQEIRKSLAKATGRIDNDVTQTEVRGVLAARDALALGKDMKGALSDKDREFLQRIATGSSKLDPEASRQALSLMNMLQRKKLLSNNATIERLNAKVPAEERNYDKAEVYDIDDDMRRYVENTEIRTMLKDPKKFDSMYGEGAAADFQQNIDRVIANKMQVQGKQESGRPSNTYNTADTQTFEEVRGMTVEDLEDMRKELDANFKKDYGAQGVGLIDLIIEAKKRGLYGATP